MEGSSGLVASAGPVNSSSVRMTFSLVIPLELFTPITWVAPRCLEDLLNAASGVFQY